MRCEKTYFRQEVENVPNLNARAEEIIITICFMTESSIDLHVDACMINIIHLIDKYYTILRSI